MESRLQSCPKINKQYYDFLHEYLELGHIEPITEDEALPSISRIILLFATQAVPQNYVFNASCKIRNGSSLNDHLLVGPKLQQDLSAIILRWHQWHYVYIADIAKMFRQILINPMDADFQRILWRLTPYRCCNNSDSLPLRTV
jgi:hypothetical protein